MKKSKFGLASFWLAAAAVSALIITGYSASAKSQEASAIEASVNTQKTLHQIDRRVYSHFLEHIYNSCNGGLWGELVWNRSLEAGKAPSWSFDDGVLKQSSMANDCRFILGADLQKDAPWTDYDVRVTAKKISGREGFLIMFRVAPDGSSYYWLNLGGWENKYVAIEKETPTSNGRHVVGEQKMIPPIEDGVVYDVRILVIGQNIKVFVNQELIHEVVDFADDAPKSGCVGVGTWGTKAEFGSVLVRDLRRRTLFDLSESNVAVNTPVDVRYWSVSGPAEARTGDARNSSRYLRFKGEGSLSQANYAFKEGEVYDYSFWTRGKGKASLNVSSDEWQTIECEAFQIDSKEWVKKTGTFTVPRSDDGSIALKFTAARRESVDVDQISIFPRSWKENTDGLRPDLLEAIAALKPAMIRWPGGCYASAYRWKSGIGPQDDRVAYPIELWNDVDVNSFGIDEFLSLCRRTGAEPIMVVNVGTEQWINAVGDPSLRSNDWLQEVCDWLEYCNGDASTKWGAVRAKNGHAEPYGVKYWEIDNEVMPSSTPSEKYVKIVNDLVPRMKAIDPSIKIIACGSFMGDRAKWDGDVIKGTAKNIDFLSTHRYDDPNGFAVNPWDNKRFFDSRREMIANSDNPNIKIFNSEWNAQSTDWRTGLHAGGYLNCNEMASDVTAIASPALFLRHKSANAWDNAFVNFDSKGWYPAPNYVVMKLWSDSFAPNLIELTSSAPELNGDNPIVNAVATKSEDGKTVYVKIVNNSEKDVEFNLSFDASVNLADAAVSASIVTPTLNGSEKASDKLRKRNTFENPNAIAPRDLAISVVDGKAVFKAESYSAVVVKIESK